MYGLVTYIWVVLGGKCRQHTTYHIFFASGVVPEKLEKKVPFEGDACLGRWVGVTAPLEI